MGRITGAPHTRPDQGRDGLWALKNYKRLFLYAQDRCPANRKLQGNAKQMRTSNNSCLLTDDSSGNR